MFLILNKDKIIGKSGNLNILFWWIYGNGQLNNSLRAMLEKFIKTLCAGLNLNIFLLKLTKISIITRNSRGKLRGTSSVTTQTVIETLYANLN